MSKIDQLLDPYRHFIEAIVMLFDPFVEVAVHDLRKGTLAAIYNSFSKRKVGDKSPLKELNIDIGKFPDVFPSYNKQNWDGKQLKCTSITVRDELGDPALLICINLDTSVLVQTKELLDAFLNVQAKAANPIEAFGKAGEEQIAPLIEQFLKEHGLSKRSICREDKKKIIEFLYRKGVFHFKNAVPFVAKNLNLSRASIYNYINEIGAH